MPTVEFWIQKASRALRLGRLAREAAEPLWDAVCFQAQQTAEMYLKGFLAEKGLEPPKTHDIKRLVELCSEHNASIKAYSSVAAKLTEYAGLSRYFNIPDERFAEVADELLQAAENIGAVLFPPHSEDPQKADD